MIKMLLRQDGFGRMVVMIMVCVIALAPVSCRMLESDQGGVIDDDPCTAAVTLAQQFMGALDQWDRDALLSTLMPDQRIPARAAWLVASQRRERSNVDLHMEDLTYECLPDDGGTSVAVEGTISLIDRDSGVETQRIEDFDVELSIGQVGDAWYLLVNMPDIMHRIQGEEDSAPDAGV